MKKLVFKTFLFSLIVKFNVLCLDMHSTGDVTLVANFNDYSSDDNDDNAYMAEVEKNKQPEEPVSPKTEVSYENTCQLQVQSETYTTRKEQVIVAYAGNGYNYEVNCHINDAKMRPGDKYYIIDLILYGPNMRVTKAWREQFTTNGHNKNRNFHINKKISYRLLGINSFVCSVTKYNNLVNKFTRTCQKALRVNVTEKSQVKVESLDGLINIYSQKSSTAFFESERSTNERLVVGKFLNLKQRLIAMRTSTSFKSSKSFTLSSTSSTKQSDIKSTTRVDKHEENLSAKAMQFRDIFEVASTAEDKTVKSIHEDQDKHNLTATKFMTGKIDALQPLFIIALFLIVFFISIATIIYLTYFQKSNDDDYGSVKPHDSNHSDSDLSEVTARAKSKRFMVLSQSIFSKLTSRSHTNEQIVSESCAIDENKNECSSSSSAASDTASSHECSISSSRHGLNEPKKCLNVNYDIEELNEREKFKL